MLKGVHKCCNRLNFLRAVKDRVPLKVRKSAPKGAKRRPQKCEETPLKVRSIIRPKITYFAFAYLRP